MWQQIASPVWMDIDYGNTLNGRNGRDDDDGKHIAPLQLDTIERAIKLWSNPNDTILTPFGGIGSELYQALKMDRKAIGFELKKSYWDVGVENCKSAEFAPKQDILFTI
jgi:DNA modification methylase